MPYRMAFLFTTVPIQLHPFISGSGNNKQILSLYCYITFNNTDYLPIHYYCFSEKHYFYKTIAFI